MRDERFESIARVTPFVPQNKLDRPDGPVLNVKLDRPDGPVLNVKLDRPDGPVLNVKLDRPDGPVLNVEVSRALELGSRVSRKGELNISL